MIINSRVNPNIKWKIKLSNELTTEEKSFIESFNPVIYHNDLTSVLWTFDKKLPSGRWLENITFNNELTVANALIT